MTLGLSQYCGLTWQSLKHWLNLATMAGSALLYYFLGCCRTALLANEVTVLFLPCLLPPAPLFILLCRAAHSCCNQTQSKNVRNALQGHTNCLDSAVICLQHVWQEKLLKEGMYAVATPEVQQHSILLQNMNRITYSEADFPVPEIPI